MLLDVRNLKTYFYTAAGIVRAVEGMSYGVRPGETVALVGESGCGKSVSALSVLRLVSAPAGRIVGGQILFQGRDLLTLDEESMRHIRGRELSMVFQEPMTSLNPVLSIGRQLTEPLEIHLGMPPQQARQQAGDTPVHCRHSRPGAPSQAIPTSVQRWHASTDDDRHGARL